MFGVCDATHEVDTLQWCLRNMCLCHPTPLVIIQHDIDTLEVKFVVLAFVENQCWFYWIIGNCLHHYIIQIRHQQQIFPFSKSLLLKC